MPPRLPSSVLIAYGLPAFPAAMLGLPLLLYLPTFYATDVGLGFAAVGGVLLVVRLWDVVTDLLVGWGSDRLPARFGRRRTWLIAALPVAVISVWFLFRPPPGASSVYFALAAFVAYLGWTMMTIPHQAWGAELSADYGERSRVMAARETAGLVGVLVTAALPTLLPALGWASPDASEAALSLGAVAVAVAVLLPVAGIVFLAVVPEPPRPATPPPDWRAAMRLMAGNAPFRRLLASYLFNGIANGLPATLFLLYVTHVLVLPDFLGWFLVAYFGAGIVGIPLWLQYARRYGKHRTWCLAMLFACLVFAMVPALGPGDAVGFLAICLATGLAFGADLALPPSMQADVVDVDTAAGGDRRTGLYFALWGMATKLALALAVGIAFPLLDVIGFAAAHGSPAGALFGLTLLYAALPVAFKLVAVALMWNFPLDAAAQAELRRRIEAR